MYVVISAALVVEACYALRRLANMMVHSVCPGWFLKMTPHQAVILTMNSWQTRGTAAVS